MDQSVYLSSLCLPHMLPKLVCERLFLLIRPMSSEYVLVGHIEIFKKCLERTQTSMSFTSKSKSCLLYLLFNPRLISPSLSVISYKLLFCKD